MAKGARASSIKTNNAALKKKVFGPVENARTERLSAKLLELASQPKPQQVKEDVIMDDQDSTLRGINIGALESKKLNDMEIDDESSASKVVKKSSSGRIERRRSGRKASIVFSKYKKGNRVGKSKAKGKK